MFQSLVGVYGFCGYDRDSIGINQVVSIPSRGLWFLRRGVFPATPTDNISFQSLVGVYGFCGRTVENSSSRLSSFQSLVGVYGFCGLRAIA